MPQIGVIGRVEVVARDAETGRVVRKVVAKNTVTNVLIEELVKSIQSGINRFRQDTSVTIEGTTYRYTGRRYWYLALGTGVGTPSPSDADLFALVEQTVRHGSFYAYPDAGSVVYWARYMPEEANGYTYTEVGIYDMVPYHYVEGTGWLPGSYYEGSLINHSLLPEPIYKSGTILLDVYVTIYIATA